MKNIIIYLIPLLFLLFFTSYAQQSALVMNDGSPQAGFATEKIAKSLTQKGFAVSTANNGKIRNKKGNINIILTTSTDRTWMKTWAKSYSLVEALKPEGFRIQRMTDKGALSIFVIGKDTAGLMYGGLELAEIIKTDGLKSLEDFSQNPYMEKRGTKFNIPLDVRTPSYTDMSDAAQQNIAEMWNLDFWKEYIDSLASYRYNFISLWSLHPFPSMVKVPDYPDVALNDVHRSTTPFQEYYSTRTTGYDAPEIVENYEIVKKITIDEKVEFWKEVMRYGKERNVDFYVVTWNIYTLGTDGKYGITDDINNPITKDYFRKSVKELFLTYPDLMGIGLTTGENMPGADFEAKENWSFDTYALGVLDVAELQPDRKITLIHRQHEAGALDIVKKFAPLFDNKNINFVFSFKYAQAHVYSATKQVFHDDFVKEIQARESLKTLWTLRNDDVYYFRWGSPDFVREFFMNMPTDISEGYYYGSDQYVWGRTFLDRNPEGKREIELAKHWYQWMLWGRLGYNPNVENKRFIDLIQWRFPEIKSKDLFEAWQSASLIYPLTTGFHWGALDFQWYIEASKSRPEPAQTPSGFHDVNRFINLPPHMGTDFISIPDYVKMKNTNSPVEGTTPLEVAEKINQHADNALDLVKGVTNKNNLELYKTIEDIRAMAYLGKYYAHKINGATAVELFRTGTDKNNQKAIADELNLSALYWRYYASTALAQYKNPLWTNRVGHVNWRELYHYVIQDIIDHGGDPHLPHMEPTSGGTILEIEDAETEAHTSTDISGYTGSGYASDSDLGTEIKLSYEAAKAGKYILEFRYILNGGGHQVTDGTYLKTMVHINNKSSGELTFWQSGTDNNWVWDRMEVEMQKGRQDVSFMLPGNILLDHVNVIGM